jgi:hypothetical protein
MKLNCRQGDLAVIVRSKRNPRYIGKIVRCVSLVLRPGCEAAWEYEPKFDIFWGIRDSCLRPIRDNPGGDETLMWKPVPNEKEMA